LSQSNSSTISTFFFGAFSAFTSSSTGAASAFTSSVTGVSVTTTSSTLGVSTAFGAVSFFVFF